MTNNAVGSQKTETIMYAVFRSGVRVSDSEYDSKGDAQRELDYWANILKRWPDGTKLEIRSLNQRKYKE